MNKVFQPYFRSFVIVFFNDILIYSKTQENHLVHLAIVQETLAADTLFAKKSKCKLVQGD